MKFSSQMSGFDELGKLLRALPDRMEKNVISSSAQKGANELRKAFRDAAPVGEGRNIDRHGRDSIRVKRISATKTGASFIIGVGKAYWLYFYEFGRGVITQKTSKLSDGRKFYGKKVSAQPARPFMRPAFDATWEKAYNRMAQALSEGLLREAKKLSGEYKTFAKSMGIKRR